MRIKGGGDFVFSMKAPLTSVTVPSRVPLMVMLTPVNGSLVPDSITLPVTWKSCENKHTELKSKNTKMTAFLITVFIMLVLFAAILRAANYLTISISFTSSSDTVPPSLPHALST
jgi:hypothetical protein